MTGWMLGLIVVGALIGALVYVIGSKDRYEEMTEEEFEDEVKKKSLLGAAIMGCGQIRAEARGKSSERIS